MSGSDESEHWVLSKGQYGAFVGVVGYPVYDVAQAKRFANESEAQAEASRIHKYSGQWFPRRVVLK